MIRVSRVSGALVGLCVLLVAVTGMFFWPALGARAEVQATWRNARNVGSYTFTAEVVQKVIPLASATNVGRTSREYHYHLEGKNDLPSRSLELTLWDSGGNVAQGTGASHMRIVDGVAQMRRGQGAWEPVENTTGSFAPAGDFMSFLSGASNVAFAGMDTRDGLTFSRYSFEIDGPAYASYIRDQLAAQMSQQGKLPYGSQLDLPATYTNMSGDGELWVRSDGLPLRQTINARFPSENDYAVEAQINVDFSGYPATAASFASWHNASAWTLQSAIRTGTTMLGAIIQSIPLLPFSMLAVIGMMCVVVVRSGRSRPFYAAVVCSSSSPWKPVHCCRDMSPRSQPPHKPK